jgi:glycogen phosphorylase
MKVLVNGGLNLSELDGWWAEAYTPEVGWALGDSQEHGDDPAWDAAEAEELYRLLEQEVVPAFYTRDQDGIPTAWLARMRESMARLTPQFSSNRALRQYTEHYYLPMATAYRQRADAGGALGAQLLSWQRTLAQHWPKLHFGDVLVERVGDQYLFGVQVYLDDLPPDAVQVELYADPMADEPPVRRAMSRSHPLIGALHGYLYSACVPASRPVHHYTPRIVPHHAAAAVPLEAAQILWQR